MNASSGLNHGFDVRAYGAAGDGRALDTAPIQQAVDDCNVAGGGVVFLPPREGTQAVFFEDQSPA